MALGLHYTKVGRERKTWRLNPTVDVEVESPCTKRQRRCWTLYKLLTVLSYIIRRCFCRVKSASSVKPHALPHTRDHECLGNIYISSTGTMTNSPTETGSPIGHVDLDLVPYYAYDDGDLPEYLSPQKIRICRDGTPRKHFPRGYSKSRDDFILEVERNGDSVDIVTRIDPSNGDMMSLNSCGDRETILPDRMHPPPISLTLGPNPLPPHFSLDPKLNLKVLTIEFDLRSEVLGDMTSEAVFALLQMAFLHPHLQEFRVRIDNWRNYIHQKETILPVSVIGPQFRSDYPMRLQTLIVYCPGITLHHLLIWEGFILSQRNLETLICNFDALEWIFYKGILENVKSSLCKLELYSITNHNGNIEDILPFDWEVIGDCQHLESVKLWGDMRYYGLRHTNLETLRMEKLIEIELRFVDLTIKDIEHLLLQSVSLRHINLLYFTPIPIPLGPETSLPADTFHTIVGLALSEQRLHFLSFTDYKLPGSIMGRQIQLEGYCDTFGYSSNWSEAGEDDGGIRNSDVMEFFLIDPMSS